MSSPEPTNNAALQSRNWSHTILVAALVLVGVGLVFRALKSKYLPEVAHLDKSCVDETKAYAMTDNYMSGIIDRGEEFQVLVGYYECNPVQPKDIVLFNDPEKQQPVVKVVRAVPEDKFAVFPDKRDRRWNIKINGETLVHRDDPYSFGLKTAGSPLLNYEKENGSKVPTGQVIIFSYKPPGIQDSSTFGTIPISKLIGKVIVDPARLEKIGKNF